ncbi:MAG TPA: DUF2339 domain-containing protein, partial [Thermoanaerobaculia bacterium]|nr:DUF2339 domain-containing protein [Thermoanaerobaculia bacterium]
RDFSWSALWMAYASVLIAIGFARSSPFLRWLALSLFGVTIAKVFLYDLSELERVYRILSFLVLGALLLAVSFAYQSKGAPKRAPASPREESAPATSPDPSDPAR